MTKILILGCSFTQGHKRPYENSWSHWLAQRHPQLQFIDLSKGGSSIQWANYMYNEASERNWYDVCIAQITTQFRLTLYPELFSDIIECLYKRSPNHLFLDNDKLEEHSTFANSGWLGEPKHGWPGNSAQHVPFVRDYFTNLPNNFHNINYTAISEYLIKRADFSFKWLGGEGPSDVPIIRQIFKDRWDELLIDDFGHFGVEGSRLVADWVEENFLKPQGII
jgi:hypothetical protein